MVDTANGNYLWLLQANNLKKVSVNNPLQIYFDIDQTVTLVKGYISGNYIYLAVNDDTYIGKRYSLANPTITYSSFTLPEGITEAPVDVLANGSDLFYLFPGSGSGQNAKIVKMSTTGTFDQTIDLSTVTNAKSFTIDNNGELWIVTNSSPVEYVRVYETSGGVWAYTVNTG